MLNTISQSKDYSSTGTKSKLIPNGVCILTHNYLMAVLTANHYCVLYGQFQSLCLSFYNMLAAAGKLSKMSTALKL